MSRIIFNIQAVVYGQLQNDELVLEYDSNTAIEDKEDADAYVEKNISNIMDEQDYSTVLDWEVLEFGADAKTAKERKAEEKKKAKLEKEERLKASKAYEAMEEVKAVEKIKEDLPQKQAEHKVPDPYTPEYYDFLKRAWVMGCITPQDEILSVIAWFSDAQMHGDYFPNVLSARRWRWDLDNNFDRSVYGNTMAKEDWERVRDYITRKYDIRFMENGWVDYNYIYKKAGDAEYKPEEN